MTNEPQAAVDWPEKFLEAWILEQQEFNPEILRTTFVRSIWTAAFKTAVLSVKEVFDLVDKAP